MKSQPRIPESGAEFINSELGMTLADATVDQLGTCRGAWRSWQMARVDEMVVGCFNSFSPWLTFKLLGITICSRENRVQTFISWSEMAE